MKKTKTANNILVIHGPNLNMLGKREPEKYGSLSLEKINRNLKSQGKKLGLKVETFQSNQEGLIVEKIQKAMGTFSGLIINPAAYTHTSVAIRDALLLLDMPVIEVHISNIYKRESFRHRSMMADVVTGQVSGLGPGGYGLALAAMAEMVN